MKPKTKARAAKLSNVEFHERVELLKAMLNRRKALCRDHENNWDIGGVAIPRRVAVGLVWDGLVERTVILSTGGARYALTKQGRLFAVQIKESEEHLMRAIFGKAAQ
jgi:hypothetical protein